VNRWLTKNRKILAVILTIILLSVIFAPIITSENNNSPLDEDITIINVYSYPTVGGEWTVMFTTVGRGNLTITVVNDTSWTNNDSGGYDLQFLEIKSGNETLNYSWIDGSVVVENYSSNETGYETSQVLTSGRHTLRFQFGDDVEYAYNDAFAWWNTSWSYRKLIAINSSQILSDLTNFPVLVYESSDPDLADDSKCQNDGDDITFILYSDNTTQLNHEIELFNGTTGELVAWVNVTSLSSSVDTMIWMYYGNSTCSSQENPTGAWDNNYLGVWHLNETGTGDRSDSTSNNNNGTTSGYEGDEATTGKIGGADDFDGTDDHINSTNNIGISGNSVRTITFWANPDDTTRSGMVGWGDDGNSQHYEAAIRNNNYFLWGWGGGNDWDTGVVPQTGVWSHHAITHDGTTSRWYVNGTELGAGFTDPRSTTDTPLNIAYENDVGAESFFEGFIDEVRISNIVRNNSWINTSYNTMNNTDTFLSIGSEQNVTNTSIDTISPYTITYSPYTITATAASGLNNVTLYYRFSTDNASWGSNVSWNNASGNPDTESPWQWNFNFSNGTGYYEFYSIGKLSGLPDESAPGSADAICFFNESLNTPPAIALINPSPNGTTGVSLQPMCQIWANDSDGDTLNVYWYENTTLSWVLKNTSVVSANSTVSYTFTEFSDYSTTYWWKVAVNDSMDNTSAVYYFTTESIDTSVDTISPYLITSSPFNINATGNSDLDNVTLYYRWSDDNSSWGTGSIAYINYSEASDTDNPTAVISKPAGTEDDDLMFAILISATAGDGDGSTMSSVPSGWTEEHNYTNPAPSGQHIYIYWKIASSEGASYTWTWTDAGCSWVGQIMTFRGVDTSDPIHVEGTVNQESSASPMMPSVTTTVDNCMILIYGMCDDDDADADGSGTPAVANWIGTTEDTGDFGLGLSTGYFVQASLGATGNQDWTFDASEENSGQQYAFKPAINGVNWTIWNNNSNPDADYADGGWNWSFNFPNSTGYYEFYSIGNKSGSPNETAPGSADAICYYNTSLNNAPTIALINPSPNGTTDVSLQPMCQIWANDSDLDTLNVYWYENSTGPYTLRNTNSSITANSIVNYTFTEFNNYSTTYWWKVAVNDSTDNTTAIYYFTTRPSNYAPTIEAVSPANESTGISLQPVCQIWANDTEGDTIDIYWYENSTNGFVLRNTNLSTNPNQTFSHTFTEFDKYAKTYYWKVAVNDSNSNTTAIYHFTTEPIDTSVDPISPYTVIVSPLSLTASGPSDLDNVTLYYRYSDDNASWGTEDVSIFDGFESGSMNASLWDTYGSGTDPRIQFDYGTAHSGSYSCAMDTSSGGSNALNELYTVYDFTGASNINIDFWERDFGDEPNNPPGESWVGHGNYDAAAFTNDGTTWYKIFDDDELDNTGFEHFTYNISNDPDFDSDVNSSFAIKFQQYDNWPLTNDGRAWDDIYINFTGIDDDSTDWIVWANSSNPDDTYPWNWSFNFPNITGYYEFYSLGNKSGSPNETAPASADAICYFSAPTTPVINSYDLRNSTGSKLNNVTGSLDVNTEYYFTVNVTDSDGWVSIDYINITTWYDNGSDSTTYNQTGNKGGNLNMKLQYENTTATGNNGTWRMLWPDDETQLVLGNCTETVIDSNTRIINISFKPLSQVRWAGGDGAWDTTQNTTNDPYSWNFNITVTDATDLHTWKKDEYGVYKFTSILPDSDWVDVVALPGFSDDSSVVTITYSSNYDFNMSIYFEENLTHATMPTYFIPIAYNVTIKADADPNDDITSDRNFIGIGEVYAVDIFNSSGLFQADGVSQTVDVQFNVYVPFGTMGGKYTARVATKIAHD